MTKLAPPFTTAEPLRGNFALGLYRTLWRALAPAIPLALSARAARGKEDRARLKERWGIATRPRPEGALIWIHAASVGECIAALPLIARLLSRENRHVLLTSGTVSSAKLMAERLPAGAFHQYVPIDRADIVKRFLAHWQPDVALFVESELWPNLLLATKKSGVPLALINARISERSYRGWLRARGVAARLLGTFDLCLAQDQAIAERLLRLGARAVRVTGTLKADAAVLPADEKGLDAFREVAGTRPIFLAASTHAGEEEIILDAARMLSEDAPSLLTILVPRHPERGEAVASIAAARGFSVARRSMPALPSDETSVYVADTLGELGLFYRAAQFVFMGGSLVPHGGQNPLEPALLGLAVLTGPHTANFANAYGPLLEAQGTGWVANTAELQALARRLLLNPAEATRLGNAALGAARSLGGALDETASAVEQLLDLRHART
jgi:3-deoxy-D-manno-octulosonic-acid transferase